MIIATPQTKRPYRPDLLTLEDRLPLGDGVLGLLVGPASLGSLGGPPALAQTAPPEAGGPGVLTPGTASFRALTPPARPREALVSAFVDAAAAPTWSPWTDLFAPPSHPTHSPRLPSPQHQRGPDVIPLLALGAGDTAMAAPPRPATPAVAAPLSHSDGALLATLAGLPQAATPTRAASLTPPQEAQVEENYGKLPLTFEQNVGQTDASVHFFARGPGYGLYLTSTEAVMVLQPPATSGTLDPETGEVLTDPTLTVSEPAAPAVVRMSFVGANATPTVTGRHEQPGKINYFLGNDPTKWHTNVATFGQVQYDDVYPGIDLVYYGSQQQLEYDFIVSPGADPSTIRLGIQGAEGVEIDGTGDLVAHAGSQELRQRKPFVYQEVNGTRQEVASRFVLEGPQVRFDVGAYDAGRPLVIDPVLSYSTYLGGRGGDEGRGIVVDPGTGDFFLTGRTSSLDFPTESPFQPGLGGEDDVFVTRLRADGAALVYATYFGGGGFDSAGAIAVDPGSGTAYLIGTTRSLDFPIANAFQPNFGGGSCGVRACPDAFVARLSADGAALVFSTYFGGRAGEGGSGIAVDPGTGNAFITGNTFSDNFPVRNALQPNRAGSGDVFISEFTADGSSLVFSTYLGGSSGDSGEALALDSQTGSIFVAGQTFSEDFPTRNPVQPESGGGIYDAFVARLQPDGSALDYSTYLGGTQPDSVSSIAVDVSTGEAVVAGTTDSRDFPTANPLQPDCAGLCSDAFVTRLTADGSALVYSTFLGGDFVDWGEGIALDPSTGNTYVSGYTRSRDFPTANAIQPACAGSCYDAFVTVLTADGSALVYSTYLGGTSEDECYAITLDPRTGSAVITGRTISTDFPTVAPFQGRNRGNTDAFVTRIGSPSVASYYVYADSGQVQAGVPFDLYVYALDADGNLVPDYTGEIAFFSTDEQATLPEPYTFRLKDQGAAYFFEGVTFLTPGTQELYVLDTATYEVFGVAVFEVWP